MSGSDCPDKRWFARGALAKTTFVVIGVLIFVLVLWQLADVLLLAFASILVAIILRSLANLLEDHSSLKPPWSLVVSGLLIGIVIGAFAFSLGAQIVSQLGSLVERLPELVSSLGDRLGIANLGERLTERADEMTRRSGLVAKIAGYTSGVIAAVANIVLVIVTAIYLASRPEDYRRGLLILFPPPIRDRLAGFFENAGNALRFWLLGKLVSMTLVGVVTTVGLYLIGVPSALALGFLAGVSEFVPVVGPALAAIPAILIALSEDGSMVIWVIVLYIIVQQIEGNIIMPLVQRRAVDLPPAITLFAILSFGSLFGPVGVFLSVPLAVVLYVAVKQLWVRETLGEDTEVPGESHRGK